MIPEKRAVNGPQMIQEPLVRKHMKRVPSYKTLRSLFRRLTSSSYWTKCYIRLNTGHSKHLITELKHLFGVTILKTNKLIFFKLPKIFFI